MKNKQFVYGALLSYGGIAFNIIAGLLYTPWMIHTIGDDQYALYTLALSVVNLFLLDFGIGAAVAKFLANYYAKGAYAEADRFISVVYRVFFVISAGIAVCLTVFFFLIEGIYIKLTTEELHIFKRLFVIVGTFSVLTFPCTTFAGILMANERFIEVKACNLGQKVFSVILIILCLLCGAGVYALVLVHTLSNTVFLAIKYVCIRRKTNIHLSIAVWDRKIAGQIVGYSGGITVINLAQRCIFNIMPTIIAALIGSAEVTLFSLAATLEGYVYIFADAINGMFLPRVSRILTQDDAQNSFNRLMGNVGRFHVFTLGVLYIGFLCIGQEFVLLWMGEGYELVYGCALLVIFPSLIDCPQQVARTALLASDIVWPQAWIYVGMAAVNLILSMVLIPSFGVLGAAAGICVAYLVRTAAFNVLYQKKLPIDLKVYFKSTYGRWMLATAMTAAAGLRIRSIPIQGWHGLCAKAVLIAIVYMVVCWVVCLKKEEKQKVFMFLRSRWK